jgi:hypothetical protein
LIEARDGAYSNSLICPHATLNEGSFMKYLISFLLFFSAVSAKAEWICPAICTAEGWWAGSSLIAHIDQRAVAGHGANRDAALGALLSKCNLKTFNNAQRVELSTRTYVNPKVSGYTPNVKLIYYDDLESNCFEMK